MPSRAPWSRVLFLIACLMILPSLLQSQQQGFVPGWVKDAVFYQIFPERFANGDRQNDPPGTQTWGGKPTSSNFFGGDLQGILDHLDYLSALGVNALYLNPIFDSPSNHKYNTRDYLKVDPHFGDEAVFRRLIDSCHARGMRVILDGVFNHTGVDFFAFRDLKEKGPLSVYREWYNVRSFPVGPVQSPNYECWWGYGSLPKLMTGNPGVRAYLFEVTRKWLELGIDGWRLDVPNEIPHEFWIAWRRLVKSINPDAYIVGEIWQNGQEWLKGDQFDAVMNYRFRDACLDFFARESTSTTQFDQALTQVHYDYSPEIRFALQNLLGSHDTERLLTMCKGDTALMKLAVLFQMTYPGAPMVYYGDEVGMKGGKDPGCRGTMVWDEEEQNRSLLAWYRQMIALRRKYEVLRHGSYETIVVEDEDRLYGYARALPTQRAVVLLNAGTGERTVALPLGSDASNFSWRIVTPVDNEVVPGSGETTLTWNLRPKAAAILIGERR